MKRMEFLDSLRGLAALYVVIYHVTLIPNPALEVPASLKPFVYFGGSGVTLFFVVSAFSLCLTMPGHLAKENGLAAYAISRFFRIAPLFYALLIYMIIRAEGEISFWQIAASVFFVFNFIPTSIAGVVWASWTIGVEFPFYVVFPLLYMRARTIPMRLALLVAAMVLAATFVRMIPLFNLDATTALYLQEFSFLRHLPTFIVGMIAFEVYQRIEQNHYRAWIGGAILALGVVGLAMDMYEYLSIAFIDVMTVKAIVYALILVGSAVTNPIFLRFSLWRFCGKLSYSIYLCHPVVVITLVPVYRQIFASTSIPSGWMFAASVALTFAAVMPVATLAYYLIETPGIQLGKRIRRRFRGEPANAPANAQDSVPVAALVVPSSP